MNPRLQEIQIELCGYCNANCNYCTWQQRTVGKQLMDRELAIRLLDEAKALGVEVVRYHGVGESTLHPNLVEIVRHGESLGLDHSISTNCYALKGKLAEELQQVSGLGMILAIPWVMGDRFVDVCVGNALDYISSVPKNKVLHVQMVCDESARPHYRRLMDTFLPFVERQSNAFIHLKQPVTWPNDSPNTGFIDREYQNHPKVLLRTEATPYSIGVGCDMPNRFLMVQADGTCVPCCVGMDDWGLGNIGERSLKEVWESAAMANLRQKWQAKDDSIPCGKCLKRTDCRTTN